ncbi:Olfactory receptor 52R1 [Chelonia mydas]|uniref:Olfactory receptor 52R1 n=1 Tax=Chelonia mydas TaxID=8469 RepID=M7B6I9_CHEMY|nr:Olfactory receptor 52R1 [Chelonia mydas]
MEQSLHEPMYYFLCMLAVTDLVVSTSTLPKTLSIFWFNSREIDFSACLTQMYFIQCFSVMASGIIVAMALDRYVAICHPLRHSTILTNSVVAGGHDWPGRGAAWLHDRTANSLPGEAVAILQNQHHPPHILRAIFSLPTKDARLKTFRTCSSHLCVILAFSIPALFSFLTQRFGQNVALHFHVLMANAYLLVPPMLNPIIYGLGTKHIRDRLLQLFTCKGT